MNPTSWLDATEASPQMAAYTRSSGVAAKLVKFIEICAQFLDGKYRPIAFTNGNPPDDSRIFRAIACATATSAVARFALNAIRKSRAPITDAPADGCAAR